jgi:RHS repeat-associated protein
MWAGASGWAYENSQLPYFMTDITAPSTFRYTAWTYDAQGQELGQNSTTGGEVQYAYDAAGDNTCVAYADSATSPCLSPASTTNKIAAYGYDADGRMTSMADWLGNSFTFGYDTRSNLTSIKYPTSTTWTEGFGPYDAANNLPTLTLSSPTYGTGTATYLHNNDELYSNQNGVGYTYNAKKQVATGGTHTYGYNPNGELASDVSGGTTSTYNYDPDAELTSKTVGTAPTTYAYDANGNRCAAAPGTATPACSATIAVGTSLVGYNAYNQICYTTGILTVSLTNPSCSSPPTLGAAVYSYDGNGLRVSDTATTLGLTTQTFEYDTQTRSGQPLIIEDGTSAYLYGPGNFGAGTAPLEQIPLAGGSPTYVVSAPLGVAEQWSSTGAVLGTKTYNAYGTTATTTGTISTPFGFQGAYTDPSGLLYLINRYYDPATGQFMSVDPMVAQTGQPYAYDLDDPLNGTDPLGLCHTKRCVRSNKNLNRKIKRHGGSLPATKRQAFQYLRTNGVSVEVADQAIDSFDWDDPVSFVTVPAGMGYLNYSNNAAAGRTLFGTSNLFLTPGVAATSLYTYKYGNYANYVRVVEATSSTPVLTGTVLYSPKAGGSGGAQQFVNGSWDTNTINQPAVSTWNSMDILAQGWRPGGLP